MNKVRMVDWNVMDSKSLSKFYSKEALIEFADSLIYSYIDLISGKLDDMDIHLGTTGSINPKFFKHHRGSGHDIGLKVWVSDD